MKPKEKAEELIEKFIEPTKVPNIKHIWVEDIDAAKQCALIAVDEILYTFNTNWQWCSVAMEDKVLWSKEFEFWKKVKEEISSYKNNS